MLLICSLTILNLTKLMLRFFLLDMPKLVNILVNLIMFKFILACLHLENVYLYHNIFFK